MSLFDRLLGRREPRVDLRPLWHRIVAIAREPGWFAKGGIEDSVPGRFDCITLVLSLTLFRMERGAQMKVPMARLTELFVSDMDGQLRQSGVGDLVVGKHIGRLMGALGGRLDAFRDALAGPDDAPLIAAIERNVTLTDRADPAAIAADVRALAQTLAETSDAELLAGSIVR